MRIALTTYDGRISPVYGVAREVLLVVFENGREVHRERRAVNGDSPTRQVRRLAELGVDTLICGGITTSQVELLHAAGIRVVDQVAGPVEQVIQDYISGTLNDRSPSRGGSVDRPRSQTHESTSSDPPQPHSDSQVPPNGPRGRNSP
jgi:predicted Fe-Mo cluster-binding NifX family protein